MPTPSDPPEAKPDKLRSSELSATNRNTPDVDENEVYRQIGRYVVLFQSLQDILLQISWLLAEPAYDPTDRKALSDMSFSRLVGETGRRVYGLLVSTKNEESEFAIGFHALLGQCRGIGRERNRVVHSGYVFLESFDRLHGIVMSDMRPGSGDDPVRVENEYLTPESFDERRKKIAETVVGLSISKTQLIHWR